MGHGTSWTARSTCLLALVLSSATFGLTQDRDVEFRATPPFQEYDKKIDQGMLGSYPVQTFQSSSIKAPRTNFVLNSPECTSSLDEFYFLTPKGWKVPSPGPMILDSRGQLIWTEHFDNEFGGQAYDLMIQDYKGEKYLTFWLGDDRVQGHGAGHFYMLNSSYDVVHQVGAANGKYADLHEFLITPEGTALLIIFEIIPFDVRPAGRKFNDVWNQRLWDCLIQEVDIATGEAVFEWRASEHLDLKSYKKLLNLNDGTSDHPYDPWHFNSVEKDELGNYLVSARYTHAIYYISGKTKEVIWQLGGEGNDFMDLSDGHALNFAWQHDARFHAVTAFPESHSSLLEREGSTTKLLTIFDNAAEDWNYAFGPSRARGLVLEISYPTHDGKSLRDKSETAKDNLALSEGLSKLDKVKIGEINGTDPSWTARVVRQYFNTAEIRSSSQGSLQVLPPRKAGEDSRVILGYGINAVVTEFSGDKLLCDMHFGAQSSWEKGDVQSYRAFKFSGWVGRPKKPPAVVRKGVDVYVSWNGATAVAKWILQASSNGGIADWLDLAEEQKTGFETKLQVPDSVSSARTLRVVAIDRDGQICDGGIRTLDENRLGSGFVGGLLSWRTLAFLSILFAGLYYGQGYVRRTIASMQRKKEERWKLP